MPLTASLAYNIKEIICPCDERAPRIIVTGVAVERPAHMEPAHRRHHETRGHIGGCGGAAQVVEECLHAKMCKQIYKK